jgi:hypothetical protein
VEAFRCELHIINVSNNQQQTRPDSLDESALLETVFSELNPTFHYIENADVEDGLNIFATRNQLDILLTIPKKHSLLEGLFKKSSTKQLLAGSQIPVMCIHH